LVNNGSGFDAPHDVDRYSTTASNPAIIALSAGRFWERDSTWLPGYYLGLRYQHLFSHDIDGSIMQYSLPAFTNYRDSWSISSNTLLAFTKLEITKAGPVRPYVNGGLGVSVNQFGAYTEYGEPSITIRTSPAFSSRSKAAFAYDIGCGLNFNMNANIVFSIGYDYQNIGTNSSGPGRTTWSGERLKQGGINGNSVILGATFLFDKKY
jgi:opacity protein-like surface antigen